MRVVELPDRLRERGLKVVEVAGWQTRGREFPRRPDICIRHWTAGPRTGRTPSLRIVTHGRSDLRGPLCQLYQSREPDGEDIIYVVAAGIANHAGRGRWAGVSGNSKSMGLEIEWSGPDEVFTGRRKEISELAMAAMMSCALGTNPDDACEHREYGLPAGRKIDTNLDGDELRRRMRELLAAPTGGGDPIPPEAPTGPDDPTDPVVDGPGTDARFHRVAAGDTLFGLAAASGLSLAELIDLNPGLLRIGDEIRVG